MKLSEEEKRKRMRERKCEQMRKKYSKLKDKVKKHERKECT